MITDMYTQHQENERNGAKLRRKCDVKTRHGEG